MPKSSKLSVKVLSALQETNKAMKPEELSKYLNINQRSIRYALNILFEKDMVTKIPDMQDLRTNYYTLSKSIMNLEFKQVLASI